MKDFSNLNTDNMYSQQIATATQSAPRRKVGRPPKNLKQLHAGLTAENYQYIGIMHRALNMSQGEFLNMILDNHREAHKDAFSRALSLYAELSEDLLK